MKSMKRRDFLKAMGYGTIATTFAPSISFSKSLDSSESQIFQIDYIPVPKFAESNHHRGVDALLSLMGENGSKFYKSEYTGLHSDPGGFISKEDIVLIKVNGQWRSRGATNSDVLRGVIQMILEHPDSFSGEIIIIENGQSQGSMDGLGGGWGADAYRNLGIEANAENRLHTYNFLANEVFDGYPVSTHLMDSMGTNYVDSDDHESNGYRKLGIVSYPCFTSQRGNRIELAKGIWKDRAYHDNLKLINLPVLKTHGGSGITGALKHTYGILTTNHMPVNYHYKDIGQVVGSMFTHVLPPTLNIMDMIWISHSSLAGYPESTTSRQNKLAASFDPVALDFFNGKYVLYPVSKNPDHHPEMMDQYRSSNFGYHIEDAARLINENGGLFGKSVNFNEENMISFEMPNPVQGHIKLNKTELFPGDDLNVSFRITNPGSFREVDFYFAIKIGESYYFYPDWTTSPKPNSMELPENSNPAFDEIISLPISKETPSGKYMFAMAVAEKGTTSVLGFVNFQEFEIRSAEILQRNILESLKK